MRESLGLVTNTCVTDVLTVRLPKRRRLALDALRNDLPCLNSHKHHSIHTQTQSFNTVSHTHPLPELVSLSVVVEAVEGHLQDLVGLAQAVPGPVVPLVHLYGVSDQHTRGFSKKSVEVRSINLN